MSMSGLLIIEWNATNPDSGNHIIDRIEEEPLNRVGREFLAWRVIGPVQTRWKILRLESEIFVMTDDSNRTLRAPVTPAPAPSSLMISNCKQSKC